MAGKSKEKRALRGTGVVVTVMLILAVMLCLFVVVQLLSNGYVNIGGFMMFRVVTGSMEPTMSVGSLLVAQETDISAIAVNDIVCFRTQEAPIQGSFVTHRVISILAGADGSVLLQTQGDANLAADNYFVNAQDLVGKVIWHTGDDSMLASVFSFFSNKVGFLGFIVFPCLLLAAIVLRGCVNNIRAELEEAKRREEQTEEPDPLCGMTQQEYEEMIERIKAELVEELMHRAGTEQADN